METLRWLVTFEYEPNGNPIHQQVPSITIRQQLEGEELRGHPPLFYLYDFATRAEAERAVEEWNVYVRSTR